jgi:Bacterial PH domain
MDVEGSGAVATKLPRPTGWYVTAVALGLISAVGVWACVERPGSALKIAGWVLGSVLVCWVVLVRPRLTAYENGLQLTNMVRDVFIPWERIERVRALSTFQVVTDEGRFSCVAVGRSTRAQIKADSRYADRPSMSSMMLGRRLGRGFGPVGSTDQSPSLPEYIESVVMKEADQRRRRRRQAGEPDRPIVRRWAADGIGALAVAVALVTAAVLS